MMFQTACTHISGLSISQNVTSPLNTVLGIAERYRNVAYGRLIGAVGQASAEIRTAALLAIVLMAGCGVPAVTNVTPERIATGEIPGIAGTQFPTGGEPVAIAITPDGGGLYTANLRDGTISAFAVQSNGSFVTVNGSPVQTGLHPIALCITNNGHFLYVASAGQQNVSGFAISASGTLTAAGTPRPAGLSPVSVAADATGNFIYVTSAGDNSLSAFRIDQSDGTLSLIAGSPLTVGTAPVAIAANPRGKYVHVLSAANSTLTTYLIDTGSGQLAQISQSQTGFQPSALAIAPSGNFIYTVNAGDGTISEFMLNQQTGVTSALAGSPIPTGVNPLGSPLIHMEGLSTRRTSTAIKSGATPWQPTELCTCCRAQRRWRRHGQRLSRWRQTEAFST
jgi:6-phosphogluconolactonase (cycloisomerase 2 family)